METTRRSFVLGALLVLPVGTFLVACNSDNATSGYGTGPSGGSPAAPPQKSGTQIIYTSSVTSDHSHTFAIDVSAITSPPNNGVSGPTSTAAGHAHSVAVSMAQLQNMDVGQTVVVTTGAASGHTHDFTFVKIA